MLKKILMTITVLAQTVGLAWLGRDIRHRTCKINSKIIHLRGEPNICKRMRGMAIYIIYKT